ncbi:MAG: hypothetical protein ACQESP_13165 [Candidatus Muiribacteriota bacterium]
MTEVKINFKGKNNEKAAENFLYYIIDGGGMDMVIDVMAQHEINISDMKFDIDNKKIDFISS